MEKKKVLIVEDDRSVVNLTARVLQGLTLECSSAADSTSALKLLEEKPFDLALLDYQLEKGTKGTDVATVLEELRIPYIVTSSGGELNGQWATPHDIFRNFRPVSFLPKPYNPAALELAVKGALDYQ